MKTVRIPLNEQFLFTQENAGQLARSLAKYDSSIMIHDDNRTVNAKSLLGILSLGYVSSPCLVFSLDGTDEEEACETVLRFFQV